MTKARTREARRAALRDTRRGACKRFMDERRSGPRIFPKLDPLSRQSQSRAETAAAAEKLRDEHRSYQSVSRAGVESAAARARRSLDPAHDRTAVARRRVRVRLCDRNHGSSRQRARQRRDVARACDERRHRRRGRSARHSLGAFERCAVGFDFRSLRSCVVE